MTDKLLVCKSNELIENFIFNATELELQILNYAVAITNPNWENSHAIYRIPISDLVKTFNTNSNKAWQLYRDALKRLVKREYSYYSDDGIEYTENLIIRVAKPKNQQWLEFKFNLYISDRINNLSKLFTQYDIKHISMFKSRYSFMLYEFFKMNVQKTLGNYNKTISIDDLRINLSIVRKYKYFRDVVKFVLEPSKKQINKHSDIHINYEIIKTGRTPTHIKFTVKYKKGKSPTEILDAPKKQPKIEDLKNNISEIIKHQPPNKEKLKLRKEKWQSVKEELKNKL